MPKLNHIPCSTTRSELLRAVPTQKERREGSADCHRPGDSVEEWNLLDLYVGVTVTATQCCVVVVRFNQGMTPRAKRIVRSAHRRSCEGVCASGTYCTRGQFRYCQPGMSELYSDGSSDTVSLAFSPGRKPRTNDTDRKSSILSRQPDHGQTTSHHVTSTVRTGERNEYIIQFWDGN